MATRTRLSDLLRRYEELRRAGQALSAEELCGDGPEFLDELKREIALRDSGRAPERYDSSARETDGAPQAAAGTLKPGQLPQISTADTGPARSEYQPRLVTPLQPALVPPSTPTKCFELRPGAEPIAGYQLVARLGRGSFGEVWKAIAPGGFSVALKIMPLHEKVKSTELHALEIIKSIRHPNLVTAFGAWQTEGFLIVAMELADRTLWDRYQEALTEGLPGIPPAELLEYLREAAKGIDFLNQPQHTFGGKERVSVQHRDIKPQNILLVGNSVKVADFGLVRLLEHAVTGHTGSMTPAYAAPEFMRGQTSSQSDQYCLAVTYCELRGGRLPFSGTLEQLMTGHLTGEPDLSMLPPHERAIVRRALAKQPTERWPSCKAFVEALAAAEPVVAAPRTAHGTRWFAMAGAAAIVGLLVALYPRPTPTPRPTPSPKPPDVPVFNDSPNSVVHSNLQSPTEVASSVQPAEIEAVQVPLLDQPARETVASVAAEGPSSNRETTNDAAAAAVPTATLEGKGVTATEKSPARPEQPVGELFAFRRHLGPVRSVAVSPNGRLALSAGDDRALWLWDAHTGQPLHRFDGHTDAVHGVGFSNDGGLAISASEDKSVRLWDIEALAPRGELNGHTEAVYGVAFFADDRQAISAGQDTRVRIWNVADQRELSGFDLPERESVWSLAVSAGGRRLLTASDSTYLRLWNIDNGSEEHRFEDHRDTVWCVAVSPDGAFALSGGGLSDGQRDYALRLWEIAGKRLVRKFQGHTGAVGSVAFSPDGRRAVSGGADRTVRLWDVDSGSELHCYEQHTASIHSVAIADNPPRAFSASHDGTVRVWTLPPK
jgi:WD40 repeat protein/serine/threonine protein kinase